MSNTTESDWIKCSVALPKDGEIVDTKIDDADGLRNEQSLKRLNALWFLPDGSMYVYYRPTHWRMIRLLIPSTSPDEKE